MDNQMTTKEISIHDLKCFTYDIWAYSDFVEDEFDKDCRHYDITKGHKTFDDVIGMIQKSLCESYPSVTPKKLTVKKDYNRNGKDEQFNYHMSLTQVEDVDLSDLIRGFNCFSSSFTFDINLETKLYSIHAIGDFGDWELSIEVKPAEVPENLYGYTMDNNVTRACRKNFGEFAEWTRIHN